MNDNHDLVLEEHCVEDSTFTAQGSLPFRPDLLSLSETGRKFWGRALLMEKLDVLIVLAGESSIHIHGDGRVIINGVKNLEEAESLLGQLLSHKAPDT